MTGPSRRHCLRSVVTPQAMYALYAPERGRLGKSRQREPHVVARVPVGRHGDTERRLGKDQPGRALRVRRLRGVLELDVVRPERQRGPRMEGCV